MAEEIVNRVANSELVTLDLEAYYPAGERKPWISVNGYMKGWF